MALDDKLREQLKQEHGKVYEIPVAATKYDDEVTIVVKRPSRGEWKRFRAMLHDAEQKPDALETLARACTVYPMAKDFGELLLDRPALAEKVGGVCSELAGGGGDAEAKKL